MLLLSSLVRARQPRCSETEVYKSDVDAALHDFYARWPYRYSSEDVFLHFPELRATLNASLFKAASVAALVWALNDEGSTYMFAGDVTLHRRLASGVPIMGGTINSSGAVAPFHPALPASAEMVSKAWGLEQALHAFHITALHGLGALVAKHARSREAFEALSDCAILNRACDSALHGAVWTLIGALPDECYDEKQRAFWPCMQQYLPDLASSCWPEQGGPQARRENSSEEHVSRTACAHALGHAFLHRAGRHLPLTGKVRPSTYEFVTPRWLHATLPVNWSHAADAAAWCGHTMSHIRGGVLDCVGGVMHSFFRVSVPLALQVQGLLRSPGASRASAKGECKQHPWPRGTLMMCEWKMQEALAAGSTGRRHPSMCTGSRHGQGQPGFAEKVRAYVRRG
jgi:hypothetical protein